MKVLNVFFSATGNTEKVALKIEETLTAHGHEVDTRKVEKSDIEVDILEYQLVFAGSGVYRQLPGKALMDLFSNLLGEYAKQGIIKPSSPRRSDAKAIIYCTYGGVHTGINEAVPAVKYMGQLFDHLGYSIVGEWYVVGEYNTEALKSHSVTGRMGDIRGRPDEHDLQEVSEKVVGILRI